MFLLANMSSKLSYLLVFLSLLKLYIEIQILNLSAVFFSIFLFSFFSLIQ